MNVGIPPEGPSRMTLRTYRLGPDGERVSESRQRTVKGSNDPQRLSGPLAWPACRCPRCTAGRQARR